MPSTAAEYAQAFMMHRGALLELLGKIPADKADFAPWEGGRTFIQLTDHLASTSNGLVSTIGGQKPERLEPSPDFPAALGRIQTITQSAQQAIASLSESQLSAEVPAFGRSMPLYRLIDFMTQHEAHHKGQIWLMARMIGLEPPMFVKMG